MPPMCHRLLTGRTRPAQSLPTPVSIPGTTAGTIATKGIRTQCEAGFRETVRSNF
jgi:hypothetical protein